VIHHISGCFSCAEDWRLASAASEEWSKEGVLTVDGPADIPAPALLQPTRVASSGGPPTSGDAGAAVAAAPGTLWRRQWIAMAAVLGLAVLGLSLFQWTRPAQPVFRQADETSVRSLLAEGKELPREHCLLRWSGAEPGVRYDVLVTTEELVEISRADDLTASEYLVPEEAFAGLPDGAGFLWRVGLTYPDGSHRDSETFDLNLAIDSAGAGGAG
jgi:hypothetical protein